MNELRAEALTAFEKPLAYVALVKPDVTFLVVITTVAGFYLGSTGPLNWTLLLHTVCGTALVAGGTAASAPKKASARRGTRWESDRTSPSLRTILRAACAAISGS